jgi:hypothetical protein
MVDMMREGLRFAHQGSENKKADPWHQVGYRLRERCLVRHLAVTHIRVPQLRDPIHRGRSRPGWQNRLVEGRFVPDAAENKTSGPALGQSILCHKVGTLQMV